MDFVDKTLIKLTAPETRGGLFDETALSQLLAAAYDVASTPVEGPFEPIFDEFRLGLVPSSAREIEGTWNVVGGVERTEAKFYVSGVHAGVPIRVDGYWRGSIRARTSASPARVSDARFSYPEFLSIDEQIEAELGGLPADAGVLEEERRRRLLARIRARLNQPDAFTDERLGGWIASQRAASAGDLLGRLRAGFHAGVLQVSFAATGPGETVLRSLPIAAVFLIRDAGFSVAQLLVESRMVRVSLEPIGLERPRDPALRSRESLVVVWVVPETVFDDADWLGGSAGMSPAALRAARRDEAGKWLAREGIGLVAAAP